MCLRRRVTTENLLSGLGWQFLMCLGEFCIPRSTPRAEPCDMADEKASQGARTPGLPSPRRRARLPLSTCLAKTPGARLRADPSSTTPLDGRGSCRLAEERGEGSLSTGTGLVRGSPLSAAALPPAGAALSEGAWLGRRGTSPATQDITGEDWDVELTT